MLICDNLGLRECRAAVTSDHGSNMVSGLNDQPRLDCMAHRTHTALSDAWSHALESSPELAALDKAASALSNFVKRTTGIQEQLPRSLKTGIETRQWTGLHARLEALNQSYSVLQTVLADRDRIDLLENFDPVVNSKLSCFLGKFTKFFEELQANSVPTIQLIAPGYYLMSKFCGIEADDPDKSSKIY